MDIRIGHSPDPDDAFLFYGLTQGKVAAPGIRVSHLLEGIEALNARALKGELEMTAISLASYPYCANRYILMTTGASIGDGYGPIVVSKEPLSIEDLPAKTIAIPGRYTTAALLLQLAVNPHPKLTILPFDEILGAVQKGSVDAGVLIHEGQITYEKEGLRKIVDLGEWWKEKTQLPVPLGVNVIRRDLGPEMIRLLAAAFQKSLDYAFAHRQEAIRYAMQFGRGLDEASTDRFVGMYVNRWSVECRPDGAAGMQRLLDWAAKEHLIPRRVPIEFA